MTELPYEIWLLIVEYLPDYHIRRLYSVNRALFNIALDLRYKEVYLRILPDRVVERTVRPANGNPLLASRPTDLQIVFYESSRHHSGPETKVPSSWKRTIMKIIGSSPKPESVPPTAKLTQLTLLAMPLLTHITRLSFRHDTGRPDAEASVIFSELLRVVGNRLRALHIESPSSMYLSQAPRLEFLETFSFYTTHPLKTPEGHKFILENVPAFLLAYKSTIRNVSFTITDDSLDVLPIFRSLQLMPCLHSISLSLPYVVIPTTTKLSWYDILENHQQHLRSLSLTLTTRSDVQVLAFLHLEGRSVKLPNLTNLAIYTPGVPFTLSWELGTYLQPFSPSLVSLSPPCSPYYTRDGLQKICKMFATFACLQDLRLTNCNTFHPKDLIIFACTLPHLLSLFVDCSYVHKAIGPGRGYFTPSCLFSKWALESFEYKSPSPEYDAWMERQVVIQLPNVLWVGKKTRRECLAMGCKE